MYNREHDLVSYSEIVEQMQGYLLKNQEWLTSWSALLSQHLRHPSERNSYLTNSEYQLQTETGEWDYVIKIRNLSNSEYEMLYLICFSDQILRSLIMLTFRQMRIKYPGLDLQLFNCRDNQDIYDYLYESDITKDALFGRLEQLMKRIQFEVESGLLNNNRTIFLVPFWRKQSGKVIKYSGWRRHLPVAKGSDQKINTNLEFERDQLAFDQQNLRDATKTINSLLFPELSTFL